MKKEEDGPADSDGILQLISENVNEVIFMVTPDWRKTIYVSPAYEKIWGRPVDEVYRDARSWMGSILPEDRDRVDAVISGQTHGKVHFEISVEFRIRTPGGSVRWINGRTYPVRDGHGNTNRITGIAEDITERKSAENRLRDSEKFLNNIFDCFQDGISILDRDLNIVRVNHVMEKWHPYMMPIEGKKCYYAYHERSAPCEKCPSARAIRLKTAQNDIVPFHGKDGRQRGWLEIYSFPLKDDGGNVIGVIEHVRDITPRVQAEQALRESEEKYRSLVENINDMVWEMDHNYRVTYASARTRDLLGYEVSEVIGKQPFDFIVPEDLDRFGSLIDEAVQARLPLELVGYRVRRKDGRIAYFETNGMPIFNDDGSFRGYRGINRDITERKRAEESLQFERSQLLSIFDSIDEVIYITDPRTNEILYANKAMQDKFGRHLVGGICYKEIQQRDSPCEFCTNPVILLDKGKPYRWEFHNPTVDRDFLITDRIIKWPDGRDVRFEIAVDITERKRAEEALRESEEKFRAIFEQAAVGMTQVDLDGHFLRVNRTFGDIVGYKNDELAGLHVREITYAPDFPEEKDQLRMLLQGEVGTFSREKRYVRKDGSLVWALLTVTIIRENGLPKYFLGVTKDITERKRAEESLQLMQHMIDQAQDEASLAGPDGRFVYVNEAKCRSLGYTKEELLSMHIWDVDPDMSPEIWARAWKNLKEKGYIKLETRHRTRDGRIFPTEIWSTYINFRGSEYVCAFLRDITKRKETEKSLNLTQFTMDRAGDMILWVAPDSRFIYVNEAACKTFGYTSEEMIALTAFDTCPSWTRYSWAEHWKEIKERGSFTFEASLRKKDGSFFPAEISVNYLVYDGKEYNCSFIRDITERKKAEDAFRVASAYNRSLIEVSLDPLVTIAPDGRITDVNAATEAVTGFARGALIGTDFSDYFTEPAKAKEGYLTVFREGSVTDYPLEIRHREGRVTPVIYNASVYRDDAGRVIGVFAAARDITERKRAEDALQESERKFRVLAESTKAGIVLYRGSKFIYVNPPLEKITGYDRDELKAMDFWSIVHPDYRELVRSRGFARQRGASVPSTYEFQILTKAGKALWVELSATTIDYEGKKTVMATVFDITDRKRAEEELQDAKAQAELYLDLMGHDINNLNQIGIGFLEMALGTLKLDPGSRELIVRPLEAIEASSRLIANVRKLQKIKEGGLKFREIRIADKLREIMPRYGDIPGRDVRITCDIGCDCRVMANDLLDDVFSNIIHNAIKHSTGPLAIDVHLNTATVGDQKYALVAIEDDGPGIPDELKGRLFSRSGHRNARATGRGLGLYLVRTLVEDFHGKVWVENRVWGDHTKGTRFVIMLPAAE